MVHVRMARNVKTKVENFDAFVKKAMMGMKIFAKVEILCLTCYCNACMDLKKSMINLEFDVSGKDLSLGIYRNIKICFYRSR